MKHREDQDLPSSAMTAGAERIRRASYYVWFLGAEECRGLRGSDVVKPVVQYLIGKERDHEPEKVTLQVSSRGIKLIQQSSNYTSRSNSVSKHFIPASALTWVEQDEAPEDDIVSAVLLIYNPLTRCPVHVNVYRCDSTETAQMLRNHLSQLLQRPRQQAKLSALEARLASRGILPTSNRGSDGASTGSSVSSGGGSASAGRGSSGERMALLYDSLAAELREKLGAGKQSPLLLPPKDYDITLSKSGRNPKKESRKTQEDDSARSSGIGSDDAPSPTHERDFAPIEPHHSSSDDEWGNHEPGDHHPDGDLAIVQAPWCVKPSGSHNPRGRSPSPRRGRKQTSPFSRKSKHLSPIRLINQRAAPPPRKGRKASKDRSVSPVSPRERFQDARDKFLSLERDRGWQTPVFEYPVRGNESLYRSDDSFNRGNESYSKRNKNTKKSSESFSKSFQSGIGRSPSSDFTSRAGVSRYYNQDSKRYRDYSKEKDSKDYGRNQKRDSYGSREELQWPKSDRDTGYGSRDALLREKRASKEYDRGYGTYDTRELDMHRREGGHRTPDIWERRTPERSLSPNRGRNRSPARDMRVPRVRSPDRQEYQRAKSMHDLSHRKGGVEEDNRRRSMYDAIDDHPSLRDNRKTAYHFHSHANLPRPPSSCSSETCSSSSGKGYNELPDNQRFPGLDRATARPDPLDNSIMRSATAPGLGKSLKTYDYPVNGGCAPIQIARTHHDDYRRFRYDYQTPQYVRSTSVPATQY